MDLDHACRVAVEAARAAGDLLREGTTRPLGVRPKGGSGDVVTDLDLAAEKLLLERVQTAFPRHCVIAEESGVLGAPGGEWTWLIDPLDGTNNVAVGLPVYVVGLALCHHGVPALGVVHEPVTGRTWSAIRDRGALGPGGPLAPPRRPLPNRPVIAWTQGHGVDRDDPVMRALKQALETRAHRMLQLWAPLLSWVLLARGDIDGFVGYRPEMVDLPAGALIAREAGLAVRALDGGPYPESIEPAGRDHSFVAARPEFVATLVALAAESPA